ncbi:MAG: UvrD-helicase domain-containing protein [Pseudomonadota bacterium]
MSDSPFDDFEVEETPAPHGGVPGYLDGLNPPQREAVLTLDGPVLMLAGAGTGKTRALTTRLAHILATQSAWPSQILAVTFTNKAAREMINRVARIIGPSAEAMPWVGTFHSVSTKILRRHAELVGLKSNFTILDTDDQIRLLKQLIEAADIDPKRWPGRQLAGLIDHWKNKGLTPEKVPKEDAHSFAEGQAIKLYAQYQERLRTLNACDFGDLLLHVIGIFQAHADILADYQSRFRYVLVDEYQDTNVCQYLWLRLLAQKHSNICCVGDDDQSIYGWRGAEVGNILRFERDFPGAKVIRLEQNYRSTQRILKVASHLIGHNSQRLGKELWSDGDEGGKISVRAVWDGQEEARQIGEEIEALQREHVPLNEIAILVRASSQMRSFEDRFLTMHMPYRVIGGPRFYERKEIRDALAYLRVVAQPDDDLALERIINVPTRGIGDKSVRTLYGVARAQLCSMMAAARTVAGTDELRGKAKTSLMALVADFDRWRASVQDMPHNQLAELILEESGYTDMLMKDRSPDARGRLDNLAELSRAMTEFDTLESFLEHVSLVMDTENANAEDKVSIMTLHSAKGLEFDHVYLPGWEEGLFPSQRSMDEGGIASLEEERRLAYVGITRGRQSVSISHASNRLLYGKWQSSIPSRFAEELPAEHIDRVRQQGMYATGTNWMRGGMDDGGGEFQESAYDWDALGRRRGPGYRRAQAAGGYTRAGVIEGEVEKLTIISAQKSAYAAGERVFHDKFGYGIVQDVEGNKLAVEFETSGLKRVVDSFVIKA